MTEPRPCPECGRMILGAPCRFCGWGTAKKKKPFPKKWVILLALAAAAYVGYRELGLGFFDFGSDGPTAYDECRDAIRERLVDPERAEFPFISPPARETGQTRTMIVEVQAPDTAGRMVQAVWTCQLRLVENEWVLGTVRAISAAGTAR